VPIRFDVIDRIAGGVAVEVWVAGGVAEGVFAEEAAGGGVVPAGVVVLELGRRVVLLAGVVEELVGAWNRAAMLASSGRLAIQNQSCIRRVAS
jgi:hypothetical protein